MKKMIRMALMATAMFMAVTTVAKAQGGGGGGGGGRGNPMARMPNGITVDSATTAKIQAVITKYQPDMMAARQAQDTAKGADLSKKRNEEIKALLTSEQQKQFEENMANMGRGRRGGG